MSGKIAGSKHLAADTDQESAGGRREAEIRWQQAEGTESREPRGATGTGVGIGIGQARDEIAGSRQETAGSEQLAATEAGERVRESVL